MQDSFAWSDNLVGWLKKQPVPYWFSCLLLGGAIFLIVISSYIWETKGIDTRANRNILPATLIMGFISILPAYIIYLYGIVTPQVELHLQKFRPVLLISNEEYLIILEQMLLRSVSGRSIWIGQRLSLLVSAVTLISLWLTLAGTNLQSFIFFTALVISFLLTIFLSINLLLRIGRILQQIINFQHQPLDIDILNPFPLFALSRLTQKLAQYLLPAATLIGFVAIDLVVDTWNASIAAGNLPTLAESVVLIALLLLGPMLLLTAILTFTMPVFWIRRIILEKKEKAFDKLASQLKLVVAEYELRISRSEWTNASELIASAEFLAKQEERYRRVPEWPWEGRIFREFMSALIFPVLLWIIQLYLEKFISELTR